MRREPLGSPRQRYRQTMTLILGAPDVPWLKQAYDPTAENVCYPRLLKTDSIRLLRTRNGVVAPVNPTASYRSNQTCQQLLGFGLFIALDSRPPSFI